MANPEVEIGRAQTPGTHDGVEPHVVQHALDLAKYRGGHRQGYSSADAPLDAPPADANSWLPKFDIPFFKTEEQPRLRDTNDETVILRPADLLPICDDSRYSLPTLAPGENHHLHDDQAQMVGQYLEQLLREGKYDAVKIALKVLSEHMAPESMVAIGRAFETANKSDHYPGSQFSKLPDVTVDSDGSNSLTDIKLKHFQGQKHSESTATDFLFNEFTVFER